MSTLHLALNAPFSYTVQKDVPKPLSLFQRVWHYADKLFHKNNIEAISRVATVALQNMPRLSPKEASNVPLLDSVRRFLKISRQYPNHESVKKCAREFAAFKLGISSKAFEVNSGFEKFVKGSHLEQYLANFDHTLKEAADGRIEILHQGTLTPWEEVKKLAALDKLPIDPLMPKLYNPPVKYSCEGVEHGSYYGWSELKPFKQEKNPSWGNRYVFEICCLASEKLRIFGDHTWVRLKTPAGEIYSFGVYREDNQVSTGFSVKKGKIQSPDVSEFWPEKIHTVSFEIDEAAFLRVKAQVNADQAEDRVHFNVLKKNCTTYALDLAKTAGVDFPLKGSFVSNFIPGKIYRAGLHFASRLSKCVKGAAIQLWRLIHYPFSVLFNIGFAVLGGTKLSPALGKEKRGAIKPHITSVKDFFDSSKVNCQSPSLVAFELAKEIENARTQEAKRRGVKPETLAYWVPLQYRVIA